MYCSVFVVPDEEVRKGGRKKNQYICGKTKNHPANLAIYAILHMFPTEYEYKSASGGTHILLFVKNIAEYYKCHERDG